MLLSVLRFSSYSFFFSFFFYLSVNFSGPTPVPTFLCLCLAVLFFLNQSAWLLNPPLWLNPPIIHTGVQMHTFKHRKGEKKQLSELTQRAHSARSVPIHLTKLFSSWKRLIWAPAAPNHPIRDRAISSPLGLSEPSVQVPLFLQWWRDGNVFRAPCHSLWARLEELFLCQFIYIILHSAPGHCSCTFLMSCKSHNFLLLLWF